MFLQAIKSLNGSSGGSIPPQGTIKSVLTILKLKIMCVICIKRKGIKFPTIKQVETMCNNNPDGFSMVVCNGDLKPAICKTLNQKKFIDLYKKVIQKYDYRTTTMYIHARIKTHGTMRIENCHGWKENGLIFAHNGILSIANRDDLTDSETFFRDIFSPAYRIGGWKMGEKTIKAIIGTSKFVFMDDKGELRYYGHYIEDDGLLFSNTSYNPRPIYSYPTRFDSWWPRDYKDKDTRSLWNQCLEDDYDEFSANDWKNTF